MSFGTRLRKLRKENKLKQEELAKKFNISKTAISNYECDYRKPDMDLVNNLADFFKVSVDYMLGRINVRKPAWLKEKSKKEQEEYLEIINQVQRKGLTPKDLKTMIKVFEEIKSIIDNSEKE